MTQSRVALITDGRHPETNDAAARRRAVLQNHPSDVELLEYVVSAEHLSSDGRRALWGLRTRLIEDDVAAIHVLAPGLAAIAARWLSTGLRRPLIASYQGSAAAHGCLSLVMRRYERWFYKGCSRVVVASELLSDEVVRQQWTTADHLVVVRAGVQADVFSSDKRSSELRCAWRVSDSRPAILFAGTTASRCELELVAHIRRILEDHRRLHRFLICAPPSQREAWQGAIPDAAFIDDLQEARLATSFASSDVFLSASDTSDPDPGIRMLMAQASGLPVLVPNTGAHRENMLHATTGFLCRTGSEHDFASRASELLSNAPRRVAMGVSAAAYAKTRPWASTLESLFEAYRDAAHRTAAPRELTAIGPRAA